MHTSYWERIHFEVCTFAERIHFEVHIWGKESSLKCAHSRGGGVHFKVCTFSVIRMSICVYHFMSIIDLILFMLCCLCDSCSAICQLCMNWVYLYLYIYHVPMFLPMPITNNNMPAVIICHTFGRNNAVLWSELLGERKRVGTSTVIAAGNRNFIILHREIFTRHFMMSLTLAFSHLVFVSSSDSLAVSLNVFALADWIDCDQFQGF